MDRVTDKKLLAKLKRNFENLGDMANKLFDMVVQDIKNKGDDKNR